MSQRIERLQKLARGVLGDEIQRLKDPRVGFITITDVRITHDLGFAKVYVTVMGDDETVSRSLAGLRSAAPHLRTILGHEMRTRHVPELEFIRDDLSENARRIEELLHRIHDEEQQG